MKVRILQLGIYSDFETQPGKAAAQTLSAGAVVTYPEWYAQNLINAGLAEPYKSYESYEPYSESHSEPYSQPDVVEVDATEAAVKLAVDLGLVLSDIQGTGKDGRITVRDVRAVLEE